MGMNYTSQIMSLYNSFVGNDANYQAGGSFALSTTNAGNAGIVSVSITSGGAYATLATVTASAGVLTATLGAAMGAATIGSIATAGQGFLIGDLLQLGGESASTYTAATATVTSELLTAATIPAGQSVTATTSFASGYVATDVLKFVGGTNTATASVSILTTQLVKGTVAGAGSGYLPGDQVTVTGGTFSSAGVVSVNNVDAVGTPGIAQQGQNYVPSSTISVTLLGGQSTTLGVVSALTNSAGNVTGGVTISTAGNYTGVPSNPVATSCSQGTGLTLNVTWGVLGISVVSGGSYTTNGATLTQGGTTGGGSNITITPALYGPNTVAIAAAGSLYTALPANPVATSAGTVSGCTGATVTAQFGIQGVSLTNAGFYTAVPGNPVPLAGGNGTGGWINVSLWTVVGAVITNPGNYGSSAAPSLTFGSGATTATAVASLSASFTPGDEEELMTMVEIIRAYLAQCDSPRQIKDFHNVLAAMEKKIKSGSTTASALTIANNARAAAMNYIAKHARAANTAAGTTNPYSLNL